MTASHPFQGSNLDHLNITVTDIDASVAFYRRVMEAIGYVLLMDVPADPDEPRPRMAGFGWSTKPWFWLVDGDVVDPNLHVAFSVPTRELVDAFYAEALAAGATSKLAPGVRPEYQPDYYGAFVHDPNGINVEAVCHLAPAGGATT